MSNGTFDAAGWFEECLRIVVPSGVAEPASPYGDPGRRRNAVVEETFELASRVMDYTEVLFRTNRVFADQSLRSGTSVGSHTREAQSAESLADFAHKMKMAHKELEETDFRLSLCHVKTHYPHDEELVRRTKALIPLFHRILTTSRTRLNQQAEERRAKRSTK
ncbi:MAG: four helix bundle protein [Flavobacteriales bacterium]|nr:four helix bundle protein [Flavobacteriales bacterium]